MHTAQPRHTATTFASADAPTFEAWVSSGLARLLRPDAAPPEARLAVQLRDDATGSASRLVRTGAAGGFLHDVREELRVRTEPWLLAVDTRERPDGCVRWSEETGAYVPCRAAPDDPWHRHAAWFAEARSSAAAIVLAGHAFVELADGEVLVALRPCSAAELGPVTVLRGALRGHPARSRHRLR